MGINEGVQVANRGVESLKFVRGKFDLILGQIVKLDDYADLFTQKLIERAETVCKFDEKSREQLEDSIKTIFMGIKGVKEDKKLRAARKRAKENASKTTEDEGEL